MKLKSIEGFFVTGSFFDEKRKKSEKRSGFYLARRIVIQLVVAFRDFMKEGERRVVNGKITIAD